ncbi:MAG: radical SAM protein [Deltaproteobacteria bacterium]|nr:radical SAM protein [Deltaproteobacteria bacterium]
MTLRRPALDVVADGGGWVARLVEALRQGGAPLRSASLHDGTLRLALELEGGRAFVVTARPWREGLQGWRRTERLLVGYDGAGDPGPDGGRWLERIHGLLSRGEGSFPEGLAGFAALGARGGRPEESLAAMFPFVTVERSSPTAGRGRRPRPGEGVEVLVRATSRCNQACPFCSGPKHAEPSGEVLRACFRAVGELLPGALVSLTGGEPTLRRGFPGEVRAALEALPRGEVQVQTNAVRFATALDPTDLPRDPRLKFFVSLHALDEAAYDRCTGSRGQLGQAVAGTRRLLAAGHAVTLNAVVCRENVGHVEAYVRRMPRAFPGLRRPVLHFSTLICPEWNPRAARSLVRYREVVEVLRRAARVARELGWEMLPLRSSTHATMPACVLRPSERPRRAEYRVGVRETGYEDLSRPFVKAARCRGCRETSRCLGVPRPYALAFGLDELRPIRGD